MASTVPKVSICLPNLNNRRFLPERLKTIFQQTFTDWELVVVDNHSDDGAWEYFQERAAAEPRMWISQAPKEGMYANWNNCLRQARGEFIYVATSDDTMSPDCLEKMVDALDAFPQCALAHCRLKAIDEHGMDIPYAMESWSERSVFARSSGSLRDRLHVRLAPFDGLLHLGGQTVYRSITQLLIRRSLFESIGMFESTWGSVGDFNWDMRAGLVANTVHVPHTWGGWRIHASQATANAGVGSEEHARKIDAMIDHAVGTCQSKLTPALQRRVSSWVARAKDLRMFQRELPRRLDDAVARRMFVTGRLLAGSAAARDHVRTRLTGWTPEPFHDRVRKWLEHTGRRPVLLPASAILEEQTEPSCSCGSVRLN